MKNIIIALSLATVFLLKSTDTSAQEKPNILYILVDQWRAQASGYAGDQNAITPNLDKLASESVNVRNAISGMPVCTPYRGSLMTGQYPLTNGIFMNDVLLDTNATTIAKVYQAQNYQTGFVGKWHLDGHGRNTYIPPTRQQGFKYWKTLECTHDYNNSPYYDGSSSQKKFWKGYDALEQTKDVLTFLDKNANQEKPFFLMLSIGSPHDPYQTAPAEFKKLYANKEIIINPNVPVEKRDKVREDLRGYYAHISAIDHGIGQLWQKLKDLNIDENTIIVFTADHGDLLGAHGAWNKQQPYQESIKVPFLVHYPKLLGTQGSSSDVLLNSPDIMPTLLGMSGINIPNSVEGKDYSKVLTGKEKSKTQYALISCIQPFGQWSRDRGGKEYRGVTDAQFTYARDLSGPWLLFDNIADPFQMNNLINKPEHSKLQKRMEKALQKELAKRNDDFLPGMEYIKKWNYFVDETETVPYRTVNYQGNPINE
ncbi:Arylsulfatase A [Spirosomataceae bacterium TFI 002]|nr:Arylsulfatase A [Spirosomataceae bacterium TFI 002]